ncbi:tape measure protein [Acinetobacter sp. TY2]|uniref:tape measure protein n=1 Tax=Acinetobacter sp. TY2 TaxID=3387403 RepID=UPI003917B12D
MAEQRSTLIIEISSEQARRNAQALDRELRSIQNSGNYASTSMNSMSVACRQLAGYMMGVVTVGAAIGKMDEYTNLNNRLRLVTDTQKELTLAMKDTFNIAQRSGAAWGGTAAIYQKIQYNSEKLGLSQTQVAKVTESISKSISNSGSSAQAASAALYQLGQSFDKSSLNGDEFVSMSENAGYLMEVFSKGLGVTRAELKEMSSQGLLTTDKMIEAIQKMSGSIEEDFGKTNFTIGQGFTQLSNAVTKFVGEAGQGSGAATVISDSLGTLAENLNSVTNIAMIGGAYWVGTYIPAIYASTVAGYGKIKQLAEQTIIQYAAVQAERAAAVTALASAEAEVLRTQTTLAAIAAEKALEVQRLKGQISDLGRIQSTTRMAGLRQVEAQVTAELTIAETALAAARTRSAAAATATLGVSSRILGVMTGPIGIGISIAAVAAGYLLMRDSTAEANKKLEEQTEIASKTKQELLELQGVQKRGAQADLQEAFKGQNKELRDLNYLFNAHTIELQNAYRGNLQITEISNKVREGTMSQVDAIKALNKLDFIDPKQLKQLRDDNKLYEEKREIVTKVQEALKVFGINAELMGNKASNSSTGVAAIGKEAVVTSEKVKGLDADIQKFISNSLNNIASNEERLRLYAQGYTKESADMVLKYREAMGLIGSDQQLPLGTIALMGRELSVQTQLKDIEDKRSKTEKDRTKELEKQQQIIQVNAKVQANAAKYNFNGIEGKYGLPSGLLSGIHMQESRGHSNAVGPQTKYGTAKGGFQFLDSTAKRFKLFGNDVFDLGKSADAAGQYLQLLYKKFGDWDKAISAYHAGEGNVAAGTNIGPVNRQYVKNIKGYVAGVNGYSGSSKDFDSTMDDQAKYAQKTLEEIDQLNAKYSNADITRNKDRLTEIAEAERLGQTQLIDQINLRYSDESYLAKLQLDQQVNGWKWVGEERINKEAEINRAVTNASKEFSKDQKQLVMNGINALSKYEIDEYRKTQQLKIAEYQVAFSQPLTELQAEVLNMQAKAIMGGGYGAWALQNQKKDDFKRLGENYDKNVNNINEDKIITDDAVRKQMLLDAEESFRLSKLKLNEKYTLLERDLAKTQQQEQLSLLSGILSNAQTTFSQLTQSAKDGAGEQSTMYRTMFALQQGFSIASSILAAHTAYTQAFADPSAMTLPQKIAGGMTVMAALMPALATISSVSLQGMAHDGIDNVPKEGTWLLDKGERVVDSRTNADLKNYLSNSKQQGAQIVINNNASTKVSATQGADGKTYITIDEVEGFINNSLQNPNSSMSKGISRGFNTQRRR